MTRGCIVAEAKMPSHCMHLSSFSGRLQDTRALQHIPQIMTYQREAGTRTNIRITMLDPPDVLPHASVAPPYELRKRTDIQALERDQK